MRSRAASTSIVRSGADGCTTTGSPPAAKTATTRALAVTSASKRRAVAPGEKRAGMTINGRRPVEGISGISDPGRFEIGVLLQRVPRLVSPEARQLDAAERDSHVPLLITNREWGLLGGLQHHSAAGG